VNRQRGPTHGQATVELALALPLIVLMMLLVVQVGLVVRDHVIVVHASREGARQVAVDARPGAARRAVLEGAALTSSRTSVRQSSRGRPGDRVTVTVAYRSMTNVPLVGLLVPDIEVRAETTMRVER